MISARQTRGRTPVPFFDLRPSHASLNELILGDIADALAGTAFINGPAVAAFEEAFADYCGAARCVGLASGLDALRLALIAAGVGPGDEVIVPAGTFIATFEAVSQVGAVPVVVDVSADDYCMDAEAAEAAVTARTRAILPVHLYGQLADMVALRRVAARNELLLLEDACQAHGAERDGLRAGAAGDAAAFSFYPSKNLGAAGDAGALVTGAGELADRVRSLREHGQEEKYLHEEIGYTARLDAIQALVLSRKLRCLDDWNVERRAIAAFYSRALAGLAGLVLPPVAPGSDPVWHLYVVRVAEPEALAASLADRGIGTGRHYPQPPHLSNAYRALGHRAGSFPVAETLSSEGLSLPLFPGMSEEQMEAVVTAIAALCSPRG